MAQELLKKLRPDLEVFSRGLYADPNYVVPQKVHRFLTACGITPPKHISTQLSAADVETADLVLLMENQQLEHVLDAFAQHTDKCYLLLDFAYGQEKDLPDPIDLSGSAFDEQAKRLSQAISTCAKGIPHR